MRAIPPEQYANRAEVARSVPVDVAAELGLSSAQRYEAARQRPHDAIIQITRTNICGSDLHMYEGRTDMEPGRVLGHENLGRLVEVGAAVEQVKVGDMVCVPFSIACGPCQNCERGLTNYCLVANPDPNIAGAAYGFADMGPWNGGQAAAYSATLKSAGKVMVVDRHPDRLALADKIGAMPIDDSKASPVDQVMEQTNARPDPPREGQPLLHRVPRASAGPRARGLRAFRRP